MVCILQGTSMAFIMTVWNYQRQAVQYGNIAMTWPVAGLPRTYENYRGHFCRSLDCDDKEPHTNPVISMLVLYYFNASQSDTLTSHSGSGHSKIPV